MPGGRPPHEFCQPIADEILERMAVGEGLTIICRDPHVPSISVIYKWLHSNSEFAEAYGRARENMAESLADKARLVSETTHVQLPNGMYVAADPQFARLQVDTLKWSAAHLKPGRWGDKTQIELSGHVALTEFTDEDLEAELLLLISTGKLLLPDGLVLATDEEDFSDLL